MTATELPGGPPHEKTTPTQLTREQLYDRVWAEPMRTLAPKYGLSDVGLAKTCRRMRIPLPGRGYWAKKAAGQPVKRARLPEVLASSELPLVFVPHHDADTSVEVESDGVMTGPPGEWTEFEARPEHRILVAEVLTKPHPLVAQTVKALRRTKPDAAGYLPRSNECLDVKVSIDSADRAMCILDALLDAADLRGWPTTIKQIHDRDSRAPTVIRVQGEDVAISLVERLHTVERPNPKEAKRPAGGRALAAWQSVHGYANPLPPIRETVATGQFTLKIEEYAPGLRCSWSDGKKQRIDQSLNDVMVGLVSVAEVLKQRRHEAAEHHRKYVEEEERRQREEQERAEDATRIRALEREVQHWRAARDIPGYVAEVTAALETLDDPAAEVRIRGWLAWAARYADRLDPLLPMPTIPKDAEPYKKRW